MKINFITVKMRCPKYCSDITAHFRYVVLPTGEYIFSPFDGCENKVPCEVCKNCIDNENRFIEKTFTLSDFLSRFQPL